MVVYNNPHSSFYTRDKRAVEIDTCLSQIKIKKGDLKCQIR